MDPCEWQADDSDTPSLAVQALRGGRVNLAGFAAKSPSEALRELGSGMHAKEVELVNLQVNPIIWCGSRPASPELSQWREAPLSNSISQRILGLLSKSLAPAKITEARVITQYDAYYIDRHQEHPLPALLVRVNDSADSALYIGLVSTAGFIMAFIPGTCPGYTVIVPLGTFSFWCCWWAAPACASLR
jgi:hypothetical protein